MSGFKIDLEKYNLNNSIFLPESNKYNEQILEINEHIKTCNAKVEDNEGVFFGYDDVEQLLTNRKQSFDSFNQTKPVSFGKVNKHIKTCNAKTGKTITKKYCPTCKNFTIHNNCGNCTEGCNFEMILTRRSEALNELSKN